MSWCRVWWVEVPRVSAKIELAAEKEFDVTVVNDSVERAAKEIAELIGAA